METAILGGGCFWCTEAAYENIEGVEKVTAGYAGGKTENPTYRQVCSGKTGHAEVIKIEYDETKISFEDVLRFFFRIHDPTTEDRQGPDVGSQYRSIILYKNPEQREIAEEVIREKQDEYEDEIVTELNRLEKFYRAEDKHQKYFEKNPNDAYCKMHAQPKKKKAEKFSAK